MVFDQKLSLSKIKEEMREEVKNAKQMRGEKKCIIFLEDDDLDTGEELSNNAVLSRQTKQPNIQTPRRI